MSSSGVVTFRSNRDAIINGALRLCNAIDPENVAGPTATQVTNAAEALNMLVKQWEANGLQLWERRYGVIFPQKGQPMFVLGSPGPAGDHACLATPLGLGGFVQTTLSASAATNAGTVTVTTISSPFSVGVPVVSMASAYNIGIELDTGFIQWTTINGAPSGTTVTLTTPLTSAATSGNTVYCYQTKLMRPLRILDAWIRQVGSNDTPVNVIPREHFNRFGLKSSQGSNPTQLYHDPQANASHVYIYPEFIGVDNQLYIEFQKPIDDFASSTDDFDMPQEWGNALKFNLALMIAPEYDVPDSKFKQIQYLADGSFAMVEAYDQEDAPFYIQPNDQLNHATNK